MATAMASSPRRRPCPTVAAASTRPPRAATLTHPVAGAAPPHADPIGRVGLRGRPVGEARGRWQHRRRGDWGRELGEARG